MLTSIKKTCGREMGCASEEPDITTAEEKALGEYVREKGLHQPGLQWYLECFRYGMPPHGGWGMGGARFIKQLLDLPSLREATFLFRRPTRLMP